MPRQTFVRNEFPSHLLNSVVHGDCLSLLSELADQSVGAIITDPPWPDCNVSFADDPLALFNAFALEAARVTSRLVVVLGCDTDPRFLSGVPKSLPFFRVCWLRRIPGTYRGSLFYSADVAYAFSHAALNDKDRVIGGEVTGVLQSDVDNNNPHPTKRHIAHMSWLVQKFTRPTDVVLDPFCGSGTTLVAAKKAGRAYCGIDKVSEYVEFAKLRFSEAHSLFDGDNSEPLTRTRGSFTHTHKKTRMAGGKVG